MTVKIKTKNYIKPSCHDKEGSTERNREEHQEPERPTGIHRAWKKTADVHTPVAPHNYVHRTVRYVQRGTLYLEGERMKNTHYHSNQGQNKNNSRETSVIPEKKKKRMRIVWRTSVSEKINTQGK